MVGDNDPQVANEWTLVAVLHHRPGRPTAVDIVDHSRDIDLDAWSRAEGWCERCRTRRARCVTYLLRNDRGRLAQVGANCLEGFTGHPRAHDLLVRRRHHPSRGARSLRLHPRGATVDPVDYFDLRGFLAHAAQAMLDGGFVPANAGNSRRPPTWVQALTALEHGRPPGRRAVRRASEVVAWAREELKAQEAFERRLVELLSQERLTRRELPTAAAAVHSYHRHLHRLIAARGQTGRTDPTDVDHG